MANHDLAVDRLLNYGLRESNLDNVLASNCVMDWFGRTFIGQRKIIDFYHNSNASHEHSMANVITSEAFEDRPYHLLTREQPLENLKSAPDLLTGDEQWFDCETHSPVDLKEGQRTPLNKSTPSARCPPAPCRYGVKFEISDDELEADDTDDLDESGIRPLDSSTLGLMREKAEKSPSSKRLRREENSTLIEEPCEEPTESRFSELHYLEATGSVTIKRQSHSNNETEKRECKMLISYRVCKDDPTTVQVALIVYKSNSKNPKTRRNLMSEFDLKSDEMSSPSPLSTPSTSRCRTTMKERKKSDDEKTMEALTAPAGHKFSKATKRSISKTSLRF